VPLKRIVSEPSLPSPGNRALPHRVGAQGHGLPNRASGHGWGTVRGTVGTVSHQQPSITAAVLRTSLDQRRAALVAESSQKEPKKPRELSQSVGVHPTRKPLT
jgi:hypothetical protein